MTQAVRSGRLRDSVRREAGKPFIADVALADQEWSAARPTRVPGGAASAPSSAAASEAQTSASSAGGAPPPRLDDFAAPGIPSVAVSRARIEAVRAALATMELSQKTGKLVSVEVARSSVIEKFTAVRTRLLGLPTRIRQRLPHLTADDVRVIDSIIREALEEIADGR